MKKLFTLRSLFAIILLLISVSALVSGVKEGVRDVQDAAFFPVAAFAVLLSYALGLSIWPALRVWSIVLMTGFIVAFIESARLVEPIKSFLRAIPQYELELIRWMWDKEGPDFSLIQSQFNTIKIAGGVFTSQVLSISVDHPSVREFFWDIPLLILTAWAGWGIGRWNHTLVALAPSLAFHAFILNYTGKDTLSLQIAVFILILLIGMSQKWSYSQEKTDNTERAARETYSAIILLSMVLALAAGITPSFSILEVAKKLTNRDEFAKTIGLEREKAQIYTISGLPRQHFIGQNPGLSQTVVFTVKTGELASSEDAIIEEAVPRHYWRWITYDVYNGQGWATSPVEEIAYSADDFLIPVGGGQHQIIHQQVEKAFTEDSRLYWTGFLASVDQPFKASWRAPAEFLPSSTDPTFGADMLGAITEMEIYQADSLIPLASINQLHSSLRNYPQEILTRYLALPETTPLRVRDLAHELTVNLTNPYDQAKAIEAHLRGYPYSLDVDPPPPNQDVADYFLFDLKKGYCDYYATSMVVMARSVGLPARLVIGYANGIYDPINAEYVIHESDAHSWVEIYFTGIGWIEFEPTASQMQISLPEELPNKDISFGHKHFSYAKNGYFAQKDILPLITGLSLFILIISIYWFFSVQGLLKSYKTIGSIYKNIYYHGKKIYRDAPLHETPIIFAENLRRQLRTGYSWLIPAPDEIKVLTDLYIREAYSAHPITREEHVIAVKVWRKLFWRLLYARIRRL